MLTRKPVNTSKIEIKVKAKAFYVDISFGVDCRLTLGLVFKAIHTSQLRLPQHWSGVEMPDRPLALPMDQAGIALGV